LRRGIKDSVIPTEVEESRAFFALLISDAVTAGRIFALGMTAVLTF
jgi:hypothetical protein